MRNEEVTLQDMLEIKNDQLREIQAEYNHAKQRFDVARLVLKMASKEMEMWNEEMFGKIESADRAAESASKSEAEAQAKFKEEKGGPACYADTPWGKEENET